MKRFQIILMAVIGCLCLLGISTPAAAQSDDCCVVPGDANGDGTVNIGDVIRIMDGIFKCGPLPECLNAGDPNGDCRINVGDAIFLLDYIFHSGPEPVCGCIDPAKDGDFMMRLGC